jgi:Transposase IS4
LSINQISSRAKSPPVRRSNTKEHWQQQFESTQNKAQKLQILTEHIGPVRPYPEKLNISKPAKTGVPFPRIPFVYDPLELFHRFIPREQFTLIAKNTNTYASEERARESGLKTQWQDVTATEIGGYLGALLLIGAQSGGRGIPYYWNTHRELPSWPVAEYISRERFQLISRYIKINEPGDLDDVQWFKKLDPIADLFRAATTAEMYELPQNLGIDEQLIRFSGRSKHTIQMNSKAAGQGYKIYSLCCPNGYMIDFKFTSRQERVAELGIWPGYSQSEAVVLDLAKSPIVCFSQPVSFYVLHFDNFFTTRTFYQVFYDEWALKSDLRRAIDEFCANDSGLQTDRLFYEDWQIFNQICNFLRSFEHATKATEGHNATVDEVLQTMDFLLAQFEIGRDLYTSNNYMAPCIDMDWGKFNKYYIRTDQSPVYVAAIVLHPGWKWSYFSEHSMWKTAWIKAAERKVEKF